MFSKTNPAFFVVLAVELDKYNLVLVPQPDQSAMKTSLLLLENRGYNPLTDYVSFFMICDILICFL